MEIRFDPLNEREAEAVAKFLTPTVRAMIHHETPSDMRDDAWHRETKVVHQDVAAMFGTVKTDEKSMATRHAATVVKAVPGSADTLPAFLSVQLVPDHDPVLAKCAAEMERQQSAAPLPSEEPAPLPAAADLFATAPAAPTPGQASETPVPPPPAVPAPPQADAPSAPAAETNLADVDKNGLPWDPRIHSGTKAVNSDGSWRQRRGLNDPELVKRVEAELRALMALPAPESTGVDIPIDTPIAPAAAVSVIPLPPASAATIQVGSTTHAPVPPATVPAPPVSPGNVPPPPVPASSAPATAPIPSPPAVPAPPTAAAPGAPITFAELMGKITKGIREGTIKEDQVHQGLIEMGLKEGEMGMLAAKPDLRVRMNDYLASLA